MGRQVSPFESRTDGDHVVSVSSKQTKAVMSALDSFAIELPSWGFANTGTRFGKFMQPAAATTIV